MTCIMWYKEGRMKCALLLNNKFGTITFTTITTAMIIMKSSNGINFFKLIDSMTLHLVDDGK